MDNTTDLILCGCGHGIATHPYQNSPTLKMHVLGHGTCARKLATGKLIPSNFRKERLIPSVHLTPIMVCDVNNSTISVYTLTNQRLYSPHAGGFWSLPKSEDSINSLQGEW